MGWANNYIGELSKGNIVKFRPRGQSMKGRIESGQLCTVCPVKKEDVEVNDIVLCKVKGNQYLHIVKAIDKDRYQIGNNRGLINGWISFNSIFGKLIKIED